MKQTPYRWAGGNCWEAGRFEFKLANYVINEKDDYDWNYIFPCARRYNDKSTISVSDENDRAT